MNVMQHQELHNRSVWPFQGQYGTTIELLLSHDIRISLQIGGVGLIENG